MVRGNLVQWCFVSAKLLAVMIGVAVLSTACASAEGSDRGVFPTRTTLESTSTADGPASISIPGPTLGDGYVEYRDIPILNVSTRGWEGTNLRRYALGIDPADFVQGGPGRNQIIPIYSPKFVSIGEAVRFEWMSADHPVIVLEVDGDARAYPLAILTIHEVVNDTVNGEPVVITYCALCYTAVAFKRTVDGRALVFGTTGTLRNSNLIMWDDATESWWQQVTGEAVVGESAGQTLEFVPVYLTSFSEFVRTFPDGSVLSPESTPTVYHGGYGFIAYVRYDSPNNRPYLFFGELDERLDPVQRVLGVEVGDTSVAFPFDVLSDARVVETTVGDQRVVVFWKGGTLSALDQEAIMESRDVGSAAAFDSQLLDGRVLSFVADESGGFFVDDQTGSEWSLLGRALSGGLEGAQLRPLRAENGFWFVWVAFRPETIIYKPE